MINWLCVNDDSFFVSNVHLDGPHRSGTRHQTCSLWNLCNEHVQNTIPAGHARQYVQKKLLFIFKHSDTTLNESKHMAYQIRRWILLLLLSIACWNLAAHQWLY